MNDELFERYLSGDLSADEVEQLEARLLADEALAAELTAFVQAQAAIEVAGNAVLKEKLLAGSPDTEQQDPSRRLKRLWIPLAAAAAIVLLVVLLLPGKSPTPDALFDAYYERPEGVMIRGDRDSLNVVWKVAAEAYAGNDFATAEAQYELLIGTDFSRQGQCAYYAAICELEQNKTEEADVHFQSSYLSGSQLSAKVTWYRALGRLKAGKVDQARSILTGITQDTTHDYYLEAQELLKSLPASTTE